MTHLPSVILTSQQVPLDGTLAGLSDRQRKVAEALAAGATPRAAAHQGGYKTSSVTRLMENPKIQAYVTAEGAKFAAAAEMTRDKVMNGLLDAVALSKDSADPHALVKAWSEIGKMCGYYAPQVVSMNVSLSAKRIADKFEVMTDEELLRIAEKTIEGEFTRLPA